MNRVVNHLVRRGLLRVLLLLLVELVLVDRVLLRERLLMLHVAQLVRINNVLHGGHLLLVAARSGGL